jgi:hypothetical protein
MATLSADEHIALLRNEAANSTIPAYEMLRKACDISDLNLIPDIAKIIPTSAQALAEVVDLGLSQSGISPKPKAVKKIQGILVDACAKAARLRFNIINNHDNTLISGRNTNDINHVTLATLRSQHSRIYVACLFHQENRISRESFVHDSRYFYNMTPLARPGRMLGSSFGHANEDASWQICSVDHGVTKTLDPCGNHACWCNSGSKGRYTLHELLNRVHIKFGRMAGANCHREPNSHDLLLNFATPDQVRTLFPKKVNAATKIRTAEVAEMMAAAMQLPHGDTRDALALKAIHHAQQTPGGTTGLRVDACIDFDDQTFWVDGGSVHPTSTSTIPAVSKWSAKLLKATLAAGGVSALNAMLCEPSPNVRRACTTKHDRYRPMLAIADKQFLAGNRATNPTFVAAIISHTGEFAPELILYIEQITKQYARSITPTDLEDGVSKARRTSIFRCRYKDALMAALAEGWGRTLSDVGRPWLSKAALSKSTLEGYQSYLPSWEIYT